jgi:6-phosphogluconolactonase (cycloisomerase 2 family)
MRLAVMLFLQAISERASFSGPRQRCQSSEEAESMKDATRVALYVSSGATLFHYGVDVEAAALIRRGSLTLPAPVQYAWPHPRKPCLYVACSNGAPGVPGDMHRLVALRIDPANGALTAHGDPVSLPSRPIHITVDEKGAYTFIAYNDPSGITVHRIATDGTVGPALAQDTKPDAGVFAHQVRLMPSDAAVVLVTRGNDAAADRAEDSGALKIFAFDDGQLTNRATVAPDGGIGFGPRHLDFHPTKPLAYVSLERQNRLHVYRLKEAGIEAKPVFVAETLEAPSKRGTQQRAGAIRVHPSGRHVYVANRAGGSVQFGGRQVFAGGENNIAVFALDEASGEPTLVQHVNSRGIVPRTFAIDPSGRVLMVANATSLAVKSGSSVETVPANVSIFRIEDDGKLTYVTKREIDSTSGALFWMGLVPLYVAT